MNQSERLNGNYDLLARAMRSVVSEAVREEIKPVRNEMKDMEARLTKQFETGLRNTNENFQAQFTQQREEVDAALKTTNENFQAQLTQHREEVNAALRTTNENVQAQLTQHREEVDAALRTTNENVQAQLAEHREEVMPHSGQPSTQEDTARTKRMSRRSSQSTART